MEGFPNMDQESPLVGDILSEPLICSTILADLLNHLGCLRP
jgi:hypothetical protein